MSGPKQLGLLEGSSVIGDEVPTGKPAPDPYKTKLGKLKSKPLRAIAWYVKENELTLKATGTYPIIYFGTKDGEEQGVYIQEIVEDYEARDRKNRRA